MTAATDVAARLFAAIEAGDADAVATCFAPDAVVWHSTDGVAQPIAEVLQVLRWLAANVEGLRYDEVRCQATGTGFVQQHVLRGTPPNGRPFALPACMVARVTDGRIERIDEYLDQAGVTAAFSG